jgi:hypothetical protein
MSSKVNGSHQKTYKVNFSQWHYLRIKILGHKSSFSVVVKENMEEIFTPSIYFSISFIISLTASLIVNLSLEFHTFSKCVFPSALSLQSHQSHSRFVMNLLSAKAKEKKSDIIFKKRRRSAL